MREGYPLHIQWATTAALIAGRLYDTRNDNRNNYSNDEASIKGCVDDALEICLQVDNAVVKQIAKERKHT